MIEFVFFFQLLNHEGPLLNLIYSIIKFKRILIHKIYPHYTKSDTSRHEPINHQTGTALTTHRRRNPIRVVYTCLVTNTLWRDILNSINNSAEKWESWDVKKLEIIIERRRSVSNSRHEIRKMRNWQRGRRLMMHVGCCGGQVVKHGYVDFMLQMDHWFNWIEPKFIIGISCYE